MSWVNRLFRRNSKDKDIDKELRFHIEEQTSDNIATGMNPEHARREALIAFGGTQQISEQCRRARTVQWVDDFLQDLRFGLRMLRKDPGYTLAAIVALGIGIGANTAIFSLYDSVALQQLPVPEPDRVADI